MSQDNPDWQTGANLEAADITNLPVDIDAQSIGSLAVDLAAQSLSELDVDIASQSVGDLAVDIASSSIGTLGIDIEAQTISDVGIDIQTQSLPQVGTAREIAQDTDSRELTRSNSGTVADGNSERERFTPPTGTVWDVKMVGFSTGDTGGSGDHFIDVASAAGFQNTAIEAQFPGSEDIDINGSVVRDAGAAGEVAPSNEAAQILNVNSQLIDPQGGLDFNYTNLSGQDQTSPRNYFVSAKQIQVA